MPGPRILVRFASGVGLLLAAVAACSSTNEADRCDWPVDLAPPQLQNPHPEQACEILVVNGARTLHVEVTGVADCGTSGCAAACSSPDLQMTFSHCDRGGPGGGSLSVTTSPRDAAALGTFLGATPKLPNASVAITCGGPVVWTGQLMVCIAAM